MRRGEAGEAGEAGAAGEPLGYMCATAAGPRAVEVESWAEAEESELELGVFDIMADTSDEVGGGGGVGGQGVGGGYAPVGFETSSSTADSLDSGAESDQSPLRPHFVPEEHQWYTALMPTSDSPAPHAYSEDSDQTSEYSSEYMDFLSDQFYELEHRMMPPQAGGLPGSAPAQVGTAPVGPPLGPRMPSRPGAAALPKSSTPTSHGDTLYDMLALGQSSMLPRAAGQMPAIPQVPIIKAEPESAPRGAIQAAGPPRNCSSQGMPPAAIGSDHGAGPASSGALVCPLCERECSPQHRMGRFWKTAGYNGPAYCNRCSNVFRAHMVKEGVSDKKCSRDVPCPICKGVLSHFTCSTDEALRAVSATQRTEQSQTTRRRCRWLQRNERVSSHQSLCRRGPRNGQELCSCRPVQCWWPWWPV